MDAELSKINYLVDDAVPMKVTLPKSLAEDLAVYSNAKGMSKSDVMRDALIARINYDPEWMSRR
ncbi:ribbon-helix-helix protein, CopG family [Acinetobacter baumannii]|nr:ribbon-helix-helix protein, CopG family [Acinetobacter baumannii]